jgi:hypothetical protein
MLPNGFLQGRAEALGIALAAVAFATPTIEQRLKELQPGRGRQAVAARVEGASSVFVLQPGAPDALQQVCHRCCHFHMSVRTSQGQSCTH